MANNLRASKANISATSFFWFVFLAIEKNEQGSQKNTKVSISTRLIVTAKGRVLKN